MSTIRDFVKWMRSVLVLSSSHTIIGTIVKNEEVDNTTNNWPIFISALEIIPYKSLKVSKFLKVHGQYYLVRYRKHLDGKLHEVIIIWKTGPQV